jgi:hypothetical protein
MPQRRRRSPSIEWKRIREVFRERRASYDVADVPDLIGIPPATLQNAIAERIIDPGAIAWEDIVALGLEHRWTLRMLTEALRGRDRELLPPLVRVVAGRVVLPRHQWQLLRFLAAERARNEYREITVSDLLEETVSTALLTHDHDWTRIEAALPGVRAAAAWPPSE